MKGFFDPWRLLFCAGESAYSQAHEWAHVRQCVCQSVPWRVWETSRRLPNVPFLGRFAVVAVEIEAAALALLELWQCGLLEREDFATALRGLRWSVRELFV